MNPAIKYLNDTVYATLAPSPIHGIGVFAIRDIPFGQVITDVNVYNLAHQKSLTLVEEDMKELHYAILELVLDRTLFAKGTDVFIFKSPNADACLHSFVNHSEDSNSAGMVALQDIKADEEITQNVFKIAGRLHSLVLARHRYLNLYETA